MEKGRDVATVPLKLVNGDVSSLDFSLLSIDASRRTRTMLGTLRGPD
jgi:hypothetical protein